MSWSVSKLLIKTYQNFTSLQHYSDHQRLDCLLNRLFSHRSKKTPKLRVTGLFEGNNPASVQKMDWHRPCYKPFSIAWLNLIFRCLPPSSRSSLSVFCSVPEWPGSRGWCADLGWSSDWLVRLLQWTWYWVGHPQHDLQQKSQVNKKVT